MGLCSLADSPRPEVSARLPSAADLPGAPAERPLRPAPRPLRGEQPPHLPGGRGGMLGPFPSTAPPIPCLNLPPTALLEMEIGTWEGGEGVSSLSLSPRDFLQCCLFTVGSAFSGVASPVGQGRAKPRVPSGPGAASTAGWQQGRRGAGPRTGAEPSLAAAPGGPRSYRRRDSPQQQRGSSAAPRGGTAAGCLTEGYRVSFLRQALLFLGEGEG